VTQGLIDNGSLFSTPTLLSAEGHKRMADNIMAFVNNQTIVTSHIITGSWSGGDSCHMWFIDGGCTVTYGDTVSLVNFDSHYGKYALEFQEGGGTFTLSNDFVDSRELYLSYIVSNTPGLYPDVTLQYGYDRTTSLPGTYTYSSFAKEYAVTIPVGMLTPGIHTLVVTPEAGGQSKPFRLVAATFTNGITLPDEFTFAPVFTH